MGTNYYLVKPGCKHCGHRPEPLHIGKSSAGWCFTMRVYPELGIESLDDWAEHLAEGKIEDEYGRRISYVDFLNVVRDRSWFPLTAKIRTLEFLAENGAEEGPNNLLRHKIGNFCVGHGEGTWDYVEREFS